MAKIVVSTNDLSPELDDQSRFLRWRDLIVETFYPVDVARLEDVPFSAHWELMNFGSTVLRHYSGTAARFARTRQHVVAKASEHFQISFNKAQNPFLVLQNGHESVVTPGGVVAYTAREPLDNRQTASVGVLGVALPEQQLRKAIANLDDRAGALLDMNSPAVRHLGEYAGLLARSPGIADDPALAAHVETTLLDLAALALGAGGDAAALATMRGLRASRTQSILAEIKINFANPGFSPGEVARRLGISPRYINELLAETGSNFTDRMNELRLQKARKMLSNRGQNHLKVSDIATACGFNEISYFNRRFRRRFGAAPSDFRDRRSPEHG